MAKLTYGYEIAVTELPDGSLFMADGDIADAGPDAIAFVNRMADFWVRDDERGGWNTGQWKTIPNAPTP